MPIHIFRNDGLNFDSFGKAKLSKTIMTYNVKSVNLIDVYSLFLNVSIWLNSYY